MVVKSAMMSRRRFAVVGGLGLALLFVWSLRLFFPAEYASSTWQSAKGLLPESIRPSSSSKGGVQPHVEAYFQQVFSAGHPPPFPYAALKETCDATKWRDDEVYLRCGGMSAGLTSIVSQVKVCLKMAVDAGANLVLPAMPLRDSTNLLEYNFMNGDAYLTYDKWFDADHLREVMGRACPKMKIVHPDQLDKDVAVRRTGSVACDKAWGYQKIKSYFWAGRPYGAFFEAQFNSLEFKDAKPDGKGITVIDVDSEFLLFRITDDPTRRDLRFWNDLSHVVRFTEKPRQIVDRLAAKITRPYYGVHFRVENDTIWSPLDHQLGVDLDALDRAWALYGQPDAQKPLVYLACGDKGQVEKFVAAGRERGWEVTHKWALADQATRDMINGLAFDFQGAVDMGIMIRSEFFLGIAGSAFSSTIANQRDVTGRYRGSSFEREDEGARTHLFNDLDADEYARSL